MLGVYLENVRSKKPLIHNITNYVTVNDVANILLACGASPIMSDDAGEVEDITSICAGLCINIGTLNQNTIPSMLLAGRRAEALGHKTVLDPVGAGASRLRTETALRLSEQVRFDVIRGNISEVKALALGSGGTKGVDADVADAVTEDTLDSAVSFVQAFSRKTGSVIAVTGAIDLVADGKRCAVIRNGRPEMGRITGTRMPALRNACSLYHCKSGKSMGGCGCRGMRYGACGRNRIPKHAARRRKCHLPQPDHRCGLSFGRKNAGRGSAL